MALSKKRRFDIFKRDGFACQYCGRTPPVVVLECDHINPKANGGGDSIDNLITACFDCNRGKSDGLLTVAPLSVAEKNVLLAEKEAQLRAYHKLLRAQKARETTQVADVEAIFKATFSDKEFTPSFRSSIQTNFVPHLSPPEIEHAMHLACARRPDHPEGAIRYFCGVCWSMRRENGTHG